MTRPLELELEPRRRLWERVQLRADGRCELCGCPAAQGERLELLQLTPEPAAARRPSEALAAHPACCRAYRARPGAFAAGLQGWRARHRYRTRPAT